MNAPPVFDFGQIASIVVLDQLREGVIVTDTGGVIRYINEAARVMHGVAKLDIEPDEYTDHYNLFTLDGQPFPSADLPLARAVGGETVTDAPWIIRKPDGSEVYAIGTAKPLFDDEKRQCGAVLTIRDVTENRRARAELRDSEDTVRAFFETAGIYTAVLDLVEDDFLLRMGNNRMASAFGLKMLNGQSGRAILGHRRADAVLESLRSAINSDEPMVVEYPWDADGQERWFVATITRMKERDNRMFLASLDITDRKHAERKLASALKIKDVLLHEVNHRVKNSLQITTSLLMLQERSASEELRGQLAEARSRVETVARVHERLYNTSAHDRVEIIGYLEDLLTHVVASVGGRDGIAFEFHHDGGEIELGVEFSVPLALILVEIALNAAKYAFPEGTNGTVSVHTKIVEDKLRLVINDDGTGFDDTGIAKGTGLGQRIVRALATQLHAETVYLPQERGTAFQLTMPLPGAQM